MSIIDAYDNKNKRQSNELTTSREIENNRKTLVPLHLHLPENNAPAESSVDQIYSLTLRNSFPVPNNFNSDPKDSKYTSVINVNNNDDLRHSVQPNVDRSSKRTSNNQDILF